MNCIWKTLPGSHRRRILRLGSIGGQARPLRNGNYDQPAKTIDKDFWPSAYPVYEEGNGPDDEVDFTPQPKVYVQMKSPYLYEITTFLFITLYHKENRMSAEQPVALTVATSFDPRIEIFSPFVKPFSLPRTDNAVVSTDVIKYMNEENTKVVAKCTPCQCCACR